MPPSCSKPYAITRILSQSHSQASSKNEPLVFNETSTLAGYQKKAVDDDLRQIVRFLRDPFELFSKIILNAEFFVRIESDRGFRELHWKLTVREAHKSLHCVLDALGLLQKVLLLGKTLLKYVNKIVDGDLEKDAPCHSNKFSGQEVQKLIELKENLLKLNKFLDCILFHYSSGVCRLSSSWTKEIKKAAKKIKKFINQLTPDKLKNLVPDIKITEEELLCSVLGLNDEFATRLGNLSDGARHHQTDMYFLLSFLEECDESPNVQNLHDTEAVQCGLQKMGFTENRSNTIAKWIASQSFPEHKSLLGWAQTYVENLFKYHVFLNNDVPAFPFKEHCLNKWFNVDEECCECKDGSGIWVINTSSEKDAIAHIKMKIVEFKGKNPEGKLYFHGTDHKSGKSILRDGIKLGEGARFCDFSHGYGFYVADDFEYALQWALDKGTKKAVAVLLFSISDDCLKKCLDLSHPDRREELQSVWKHFQSGASKRRCGLSNRLQRDVTKCTGIIGPISRDGTKNNKWQNVKQICIKDEEMANEIGDPSRIVGMIFLNTEAFQVGYRR